MKNNETNEDEIYAEAARLLRTMPTMLTSLGQAMAWEAIYEILRHKFGISYSESVDIVNRISEQIDAERENGIKNLN